MLLPVLQPSDRNHTTTARHLSLRLIYKCLARNYWNLVSLRHLSSLNPLLFQRGLALKPLLRILSNVRQDTYLLFIF